MPEGIRNGFCYTQYIDARILAGLLRYMQKQGVSPKSHSELGRLALTALHDKVVPQFLQVDTLHEAVAVLEEAGLSTAQFSKSHARQRHTFANALGIEALTFEKHQTVERGGTYISPLEEMSNEERAVFEREQKEHLAMLEQIVKQGTGEGTDGAAVSSETIHTTDNTAFDAAGNG